MNNKSILIVDDESDLRDVCSFLFKKQGWNVFEAEEGFSALNVIEEQKPQVILTDVNMPMKSNGEPGMGGFDLLEEIKKIPDYNPEIYVMSGFLRNNEHITKFPEVKQYFDKPLSVKKVETKISTDLLNRKVS